MKRFSVILLVSLLFLAVFRSSDASAQEGCVGPQVTEQEAPGWRAANVFRGHGTLANLNNVLLLAITFEFDERCGYGAMNNVTLRSLQWEFKTTIPREAWKGLWLVVDENKNLIADRNEGRIPLTMAADSMATPPIALKLRYRQGVQLLVIADIAEVRDKDSIAFDVGYSKLKATIVSEEVDVPVQLSLLGNWWLLTHIRDNRAPLLSVVGRVPFYGKAVLPARGNPQEKFEFAIEWSDEDGDRPEVAEVWIDENANGGFEEAERFQMVDDAPQQSFLRPHVFRFKKSFPALASKGVRFKFHFADSEFPAALKPTPSHPASAAGVFELLFEQSVAVELGTLRQEGYAPGEIIPLKIRAFTYYLEAVALDWASFKSKFASPDFMLKGMSIGERRVFNDVYDVEEVTLFLETPRQCAEMKRTLRLPALPFVAKVAGRKNELVLDSVEVSVSMKPRLEGPLVDQVSVKIGEPFQYRVRLIRPCGAIYPSELETLTFKPFVVTDRMRRSFEKDSLIIEEIRWTLVLLERAGEHRLPRFSFSFGTLDGMTITVFPTNASAPKQDLVIPYQDKNGRLAPASRTREFAYILMVSSVIIAFLALRLPARRGAQWLVTKHRQWRAPHEELFKLHVLLRAALGRAEAERDDRESGVRLYQAIENYFLYIVGLAGIAMSQGYDARFLKEKLDGSVMQSFLEDFVLLEDLLMASRFDAERYQLLLERLDQSSSAVYDQFY